MRPLLATTIHIKMFLKLIILLFVFIASWQFLYEFILDRFHSHILFTPNSNKTISLDFNYSTSKSPKLKNHLHSAKEAQLYMLSRYSTGDIVDDFKLLAKLQILGQKKIYHNDESWSNMLQSPQQSSHIIESSIYFEEFNKSSHQSLVKLKDTQQQHGTSCFTNQSYCLDKNIFHGGHGEIWRAHKINRLGIVNHDVTYILKRMHVKNREDILHCAHREIYFGNMLSDRPNFARFITYFTTEDDYWLVFHDEG